MSKRKLSTKQSRQAAKTQARRSADAKKSKRDLARQQQVGDLSSPQAGLVVCRYSKEFEVEALEGEDKGTLHRCVTRTHLGAIVAGDLVTWRAGADQTGVIESRAERRSILERQDNFGRLKTVAANIDQMLILLAVEPYPQPMLIDRYLVAAELMQINAAIVLNKIDLLTNDNQTDLDALLDRYQRLGYRTSKILSSRHFTPELETLEPIIEGQTSIVVGQSGVGKSSLINALLPEAKLQTGELSETSREGTHTTTQAKLFHLPSGGQLIDSPGIRDFGLWHIDSAQLSFGYIEIAEHAAHCKFRNCLHLEEPECAVRRAVNKQEIHSERFASFLETRETLLEQQGQSSPK